MTTPKKSASTRKSTLTLRKKTATGKNLLNGSQSLDGKKVPTSAKPIKTPMRSPKSPSVPKVSISEPFPYSGKYAPQLHAFMDRVRLLTPAQVVNLAWASMFDREYNYDGVTAITNLNSKNQISPTYPLKIEMEGVYKDLNTYTKKVMHSLCRSFDQNDLDGRKVMIPSAYSGNGRYEMIHNNKENLIIIIKPWEAEALAQRVVSQTALGIIEQDDLHDLIFKQYTRAWESVMGYTQWFPRKDKNGIVGKKNYYGPQDEKVQSLLNQVHLITTEQAKALARILLTEKRYIGNMMGKLPLEFIISQRLRSHTWPEWTGQRSSSHTDDILQNDLDRESRALIWNPDLNIYEKEAICHYLRTLTIAVSMSDTLFVKPLVGAAKDISEFTKPWETAIGSILMTTPKKRITLPDQPPSR